MAKIIPAPKRTVEATRSPRRIVARPQLPACERRGEVVGWVDCGCQGKPQLYACSHPDVPEPYCLLHAAGKPIRELHFADGTTVPIDAAAYRANRTAVVPVCAVCPHRPRPEIMPAPTPPIAVIVPCHNYGRYLRQCLDSILAQTAKPQTIVLVDDASDDDTAAIAREYASRGVRYLRGEWRDVAAARNAGASLCDRPGYYCFVDADDYLPPNYLAELLAGMTDLTIAATYPQMDRFTPNQELGLSPWVRPFDLHALRRANFATASALIRRQAFEQAGGWRTYRWGFHDWDLWLRIVAAGWRLKLCEKAVLRYRVHGRSMSDDRHGHYECGTEVLSRSTLTTIVTLFSGRGWNLDRWFREVEAVRWDHDNLHVVAMDNSRDSGFGAALRQRLNRCPIAHTYLADDRAVLDGTAAAQLADDAQLRTEHVYAMGVHLARLYARATQYLPAGTANVWSVEDDVGVDPDALWTLATELFRLRAGAVCGCLRSRFQQRLIAWSSDRKQITAAPPQPLPVWATGFYCLLARRDCWDAIAWRAGINGGDKHPYYDWAACADIAARGEKIYLIGDVRCRHWQRDTTCLEV